MTERIWSDYQKAVFNEVENGVRNLVVNAVAGSGKTTTIVECAMRLCAMGKKQLFLAFNKSIASELAARMGNDVRCSTLHAFGMSAIRSYYGFDVRVDDNKYLWYVRDNLATLTCTEFSDAAMQMAYIRNVVNLLNKCRINLIQSGDMDSIRTIAEHHNVELIADECIAVSAILAIAYRMNDRKVIDFTDMLTMPITDPQVARRLGQYDIVYIDECQDLSRAQQELMLLGVKRGGKFVAVGDPKQAINGFAGADNNSFARLVELANNNVLPLSVCYRCGKTIISAAKEIVPYIDAFEGAADGEIASITTLKGIREGDMVICRKSAPLVSTALKFIANGISAQVKGRDIAEGLKNLILKQKAKNLMFLFEKLDKQLQAEITAAERKGMDENAPKVVALRDKIECIRAIAEKCLSINDILKRLDTLFSDSESGNVVQFSTIHKAKGLESERVFILLPNKLPLVWKGQQAWELEQEYNLKYVAITRAKKTLTWVNLDEPNLAAFQF